MPTRRPVERLLAICATAIAFSLAVVWALRTDHGPAKPVVAVASWRGLVGATPTPVADGQRVIVVLKAPSLADRVEAGGRPRDRGAGTLVDGGRARRAAAGADLAEARRDHRPPGLLLRPRPERLRREARPARARPARAQPAGRRRVSRCAPRFPPRSRGRSGRAKALAAAGARGPGAMLPGLDGHGVTIALLDTRRRPDPSVPARPRAAGHRRHRPERHDGRRAPILRTPG